jgi:hypothetical protein
MSAYVGGRRWAGAAPLGDGRYAEAIDLLRQALEAEPKYRKYAETDTDLDPLRADPRFSAAVGSPSA